MLLDLSGVGRVVAGGEDPDFAWTNRLDEWIIWEEGAGGLG